MLDIIRVRIGVYHNRLSEISLNIFHNVGPPGEEYFRSRRLPNNIALRFEKLGYSSKYLSKATAQVEIRGSGAIAISTSQ